MPCLLFDFLSKRRVDVAANLLETNTNLAQTQMTDLG